MIVFPLVSILVANYNNGRFISETLESAINQTYPNIEIVIVDDGSTDNSLLVIESFMSSHPERLIKLFKNNDHKGCGRIKRQCVELSEGDFFCFLDPEDTIVPEAIEILMGAFESHPKYGLIYSTHFLCNDKLEPQSVSSYPGKIPDGQSHLTSTGGHVSALALCKREDYDKTLGINATYEVAEDHDLYLKMEEIAPVLYVDKPLYFYRKHDHNTSWNEEKVFNNYYWKYICQKAAYKRRRDNKTAIANFSRREMDEKSLSFYLRLGKNHWKKGKVFSAFIAYIKMLPFFYVYFRGSKQ